MADLVAKFSKRVKLVVDRCVRTFSAGKSCMVFSIHQWLFGCEIDALCFEASLPSVVETFALQVLIKDSYINGSAEVFAQALTILSVLDRIQGKEKRMM